VGSNPTFGTIKPTERKFCRFIFVCSFDHKRHGLKKRWHLRSAIAILQKTSQTLALRMHQQTKCFIGWVEQGFDFLGYRFHPSRKLRPSEESLRRLALRASRLYEQGVDMNRLRLYVSWTRWPWGGLPGIVSVAGG
jgi:hypothetical protein